MAAAASLALVAACGGAGESKPAPSAVTAVPGDSFVTVSWDVEPDVEYWLFSAASAALTPTNWPALQESRAIVNSRSPQVVCVLVNDRTYWFTINARTGSAGGGPGSPTLAATPRAAGASWVQGSALPAAINAIAYGFLTSCTSTIAPSGTFVAVGPGAAIFTSGDGRAWAARAAPAGFSGDLHGVAAFVARINNTADPGLRMVAVGAGGASVVSTDGVTWTAGRAAAAGQPALRAVAPVNGLFYAVGDGGTILQSPDGITWEARTSNTTANLTAITYSGSRLVAVGAGGTIVTSLDGVSWTATTVAGAGNLTAVSYGNRNNNDGAIIFAINTYVAVGDAGVALVSLDNLVTWTPQTIAAGVPMTGISYVTRFMALASNGATYSSNLGLTWSAAVPSGVANARAIGTNGYGYAIGGGGGANASSF